MMRSKVAIAVLLAACGRLRFDPLAGDAAGDAAGDGPGATNLVFVTSLQYAPSTLGGLAGADAICAARATAGGLPGHYVAWLSDASTDAIARLGTASGWMRPDGKPFAASRADLLAGRILYPARVDELGVALPPQPAPTTATDTNGKYSLDGDCGGFTSASGSVHVGSAECTTIEFTQLSVQPCTTPRELFCFGTDHAEGFTFVPATGRRAFVTKAFVPPSSGRAAFDQECATEATAAGLPGSYLAVVARAGEPASTRFDRLGPPWVRADGVQLAATADDFLAGRIDTTLEVDATGALAQQLVLTGEAYTFDDLGANTCSDWTSSAGNLFMGNSWQRYLVAGGNLGACSASYAVYCLEV